MGKKIATITYHASYNYGSNLQAFALQEKVKMMIPNCQYSIINLRTPIQKNMYKNIFELPGLKNKVKRIMFLYRKKEFMKKQEYFEDFIINKLNVTDEYSSLEELNKAKFDYDYYISGSDQVWNLRAYDFDWANYLEFVKKGKRISYAASIGPINYKFSDEERKRIKQDIEKYSNISVREKSTADKIKEITGLDSLINIDPTLLLTKDEWNTLIPTDDEKTKLGKYILFYDLKNKEEDWQMVKYISENLKLPVIITKLPAKYLYKYDFKMKLDVGPVQFINLIKNADLVISSSFHGTVFSILFEKKFLSINGMEDLRIKDLLELAKLENQAIDVHNYREKLNNINTIDFSTYRENIKKEIRKAELYLKDALEIGE